MWFNRTRFFIPYFILLFLSGTLLTVPPGIKEFNITNTGVKIDVAAIEWPANATALVYDYRNDTLVCRTTDPEESREGAETSEIRIGCGGKQVIGNIGKLVLPVGMHTVTFSGCEDLTGKAES